MRAPSLQVRITYMALKAIPTTYKDIRFRSRLEARWAVFLDVSGIGWKYEPTHLIVTYDSGKERLDWLPDFKLGDGRWAEVKGALDSEQFYRLMDLAYAVADDVIVLGHLPDSGSLNWPVQLHRHGDVMWAVPWRWDTRCPVAGHHVRVPHDKVTPQLLLSGFPDCQPAWAEIGLSMALQARFPW
jgi:hypothetical protein